MGGILAVLAAGWVEPLMPWLLSFAAGAMVYVVAQELIPEARRDETSRAGTWGVLLGFVIMMVCLLYTSAAAHALAGFEPWEE